MDFSFEWDAAKAAANLAKHRVSFPEAESAFADPLALEMADPDHSISEERFIVIGHSHRQRLLVVVYMERGRSIRIISAREATKRERRRYERGE